jgi:hypothetical protein
LGLFFLLLEKFPFSLSFNHYGLLVVRNHVGFELFLSLSLLFFKELFFFYNILVLSAKGILNLALFEFVFHHLLFEVFVVFEDFLEIESFLEEFLLFFKELFELALLEIRFCDLVIQEANFFVILYDVVFKNIHLVVKVFELTFPKKFWIFLV